MVRERGRGRVVLDGGVVVGEVRDRGRGAGGRAERRRGCRGRRMRRCEERKGWFDVMIAGCDLVEEEMESGIEIRQR